MLNRTFLVFGTVALSSFSVYAKVELQIPSEISLYVVNAEKPKFEEGLFSSSKSIQLPDGVNQIVFQYNSSFITRDDAEKVYSDVIVAKFNAENTTLNFELPNFRNAQQAKSQIENLEWSLIDSSDHAIEVQRDVLEIEGVKLGYDYVADVGQYNKTDGVAAVKTTTSHFETPEIQPSNLTQMEFLQQQYLKMSQQDRKAFLQWAVSQ